MSYQNFQQQQAISYEQHPPSFPTNPVQTTYNRRSNIQHYNNMNTNNTNTGNYNTPFQSSSQLIMSNNKDNHRYSPQYTTPNNNMPQYYRNEPPSNRHPNQLSLSTENTYNNDHHYQMHPSNNSSNNYNNYYKNRFNNNDQQQYSHTIDNNIYMNNDHDYNNDYYYSNTSNSQYRAYSTRLNNEYTSDNYNEHYSHRLPQSQSNPSFRVYRDNLSYHNNKINIRKPPKYYNDNIIYHKYSPERKDYNKSRFGDHTYNYYLNAPMRGNYSEDWRFPPQYYYNPKFNTKTHTYVNY